MLIQLQQLIKPIVGEDKIESLTSKLTSFVIDIENEIKNGRDKFSVLINIFKRVLNLIPDVYLTVPTLTEDEAEQIASRVFLFVYNNVFVPLDLPIPDYVEVILERALEPILDYVVRAAVKVLFNKLKEVLNK
jgi:hypothetical protein